MGGSGSYYDRDVSDRKTRGASGISRETEQEMSNDKLDKSLLAVNRILTCEAKNPIFLPFDVTGSMKKLPQMFRDRMPNVAYQLQVQKYLEDPEICLAAVGDYLYDRAPIQIADFTALRAIDSWLKRFWLEGNGGPGPEESYEMHAWFGAYKMEIPKAVDPYCIFTGDEYFRTELAVADLNRHFGGNNKRVSAAKVFSDLRAKFNDNVFLIHRRYGDSLLDSQIVSQWSDVIGRERVVILPEDEAIADIILGILAVMGGSRTLDGYCYDMANRVNANTGKPDPQSPARIKMVEKALRQLEAIAPAPAKAKRRKPAVDPEPDKKAKKPEKKKSSNEDWKPF